MTETMIEMLFDIVEGVYESLKKSISSFKAKFKRSAIKVCDKKNITVFDSKRVKIYAITFMQYIDDHSSVVRNDNTNEYIDVSNSPILIKEEDISYYNDFGNGIDNMRFVGFLNNKSNMQM